MLMDAWAAVLIRARDRLGTIPQSLEVYLAVRSFHRLHCHGGGYWEMVEAVFGVVLLWIELWIAFPPNRNTFPAIFCSHTQAPLNLVGV